MATGVFPQRSGVIANQEWRPQVDPLRIVDTSEASTIAKTEPREHYLGAPTIPETLHSAGRSSAVAGTKFVAALFDPEAGRRNGGNESPLMSDGKGVPASGDAALRNSLGEFPAKKFPNVGQDAWSTAALTGTLWQHGISAFSLLWLSDPDSTQHDTAPGSPTALEAIKHCDDMLAKVLDALAAAHARETTDVLVVSDHGFSTVERPIDLPALLKEAGFDAVKAFEAKPRPGTILLDGNGGTVLFYVAEHDAAVTRRLIEWLQRSDFAGVIFAREKTEGTFALEDAHLAKPNGPDVMMAFRWSDGRNQFGIPGMICADWNRPAGKGTHATLSKFDVHNTLIAAGPDFRRGFNSDTPSGNIDVAPTILHILGVAPSLPLDGRVLSEALSQSAAEPPPVETFTMEAKRDLGAVHWQQHLKISRVAGHSYIDEGNSAAAAQ